MITYLKCLRFCNKSHKIELLLFYTPIPNIVPMNSKILIFNETQQQLNFNSL